jgi:hypothetical protein
MNATTCEPSASKVQVDLGIDVADHELTVSHIDLLAQRDEFPECRAGKVFHIAEVEQNLLPAHFVHQPEKFLADDLNSRFVEDSPVLEMDNGHVTDLFNLQPLVMRDRHEDLLSF